MEDKKLLKAPERIDVDTDAWLLSYSDMMTLIACFFILMMAFANYDPGGFSQKAKELSKSFRKGQFKSSLVKLTELTEEVARHPSLKKMLKVTVHDSEIAITFSGSVLFNEGEFNIKSKEVLETLDTLVDMIRTKDPTFKIIIEGHSDPFEFKKSQVLQSPWEIGSLRASKVLSRFEYFGFNPQKMVAVSKGDAEPILPNIDEDGNILEENVASNRRVIIKVIESPNLQKEVQLRPGAFFNE